MDQIGAQIGLGYVTALVLDWLKHKQWFPFMQENAEDLNRAFAILVAFLVTLSLNYTFDPSTRILQVHVPTFPEFLNKLAAITTQFGFQDLSYRVIKVRTERIVVERKVKESKYIQVRSVDEDSES